MSWSSHAKTGRRVAYYRSVMRPRRSQQDLAAGARMSLGAIRKIERGERGASDEALESIGDFLGVDPLTLRFGRGVPRTAVQEALPALSAVLAGYEFPDDGPVRSLCELRADVDMSVQWRLASHYTRIARRLPDLLAELFRAYSQATDRALVADLLVMACRSADAAAYKAGALDLSARLIDLMRQVAPVAENPLAGAIVSYVRTETFFAAAAHSAGLRALEQALDVAPPPVTPEQIAARGALHMRAAVIAGRACDSSGARTHLAEASSLAAEIPERVYHGTAFGPDTVRIHQVSVAVSLGHDHVNDALDAALTWKPPSALPAERQSGFYIELARAQLWAGRPEHAFESLTVARHIAPQHTREHPWVREDAGTLRRLKRSDSEALTSFAEWCSAL